MLLSNFTELFFESAPWLLIGLFMAGMLKMFVSMEWMNKQLGGHGFTTTVKAALLGAPLPLCSCGVIPAAIALRRSGASRAATTSFLVSTPETGIDSVSVSYALLGPFMAVVRPIAAITSAIVAGLLVGKDPDETDSEQTTIMQSSGCCAGGTGNQGSGGSCKSQQGSRITTGTNSEVSVFGKIKRGLNYAAYDLVRDTSLWLLMGLFFAAIVQTYVPDNFLTQWGGGIVAMLVMVIISIPMYICATASTPIAAGLLLAGVSPGAVLVFMLAGPATNIATLGVVAKELGKRAFAGYLGGVLGVSVLAGLLTNYLVDTFHFEVIPLTEDHNQILPDAVGIGCGIMLAALMINVMRQKMFHHKKNSPQETTSAV